MMTSAQSCLITSFFKSPPPKDEGSCDPCTTTSDVGDASPDVTQAGRGVPVQSDHRFVEDCKSDLSDDGLSSGSEEGEECGRKPLVVNLCGLLSPAVLNGPKAVQLALRQSDNHKVTRSTKQTELEPDRHRLQPEASQSRADITTQPNVDTFSLNAEQENSLRSSADEDYVMDLSQQSSSAFVGKVTCVPSNAQPGSTAAMVTCVPSNAQPHSTAAMVTCVPSNDQPGSTAPMKQCVLSWNSKSGTLDLSVPVEPSRVPNLEELKQGGESREEREEESVGVTEEGVGEVDTGAGLKGGKVSSTSKRNRKRRRDSSGKAETDSEVVSKRGSDGCEGEVYLRGEVCLQEQRAAGETPGGDGAGGDGAGSEEVGSKRGSDGCEGDECLQREPESLVCLPRQRTAGEEIPVAGSEEGGFGGDDSFEDFVESIKRRRRRGRRQREESEEGVADPLPCQQPTDCSPVDGTRDGGPKTDGRLRRSAAVSANARISSGRKSRKSSENPVEERASRIETSTVDSRRDSIPVAEPDPGNETRRSCATLDLDCNLECVSHSQDVNPTPVHITLDSDRENEPQMIELEDEECEVDSSVIFVSSTPPTASPMKHSSPIQPAETEPAVTSAGLSAAWAKIFSRPNKSQPSETVSTAKEISTIGFPVKTAKRKRTPSNSPRRHGSLSPSRSPRKCRSPRRGSPLRVRSPWKGPLSHSSPLRESRCPHPVGRRLAFSGGRGRGEVDGAPYEGVVHVQQIDPSCGLWKLGAPKLLPVVRSLCRGESVCPEPQLPVAGELGLSAGLTSDGLDDSVVSSHVQLCSEEEKEDILSQLEKAHLERDVRAIFTRYARIATPPSSYPCEASTETTVDRKASTESKKEKTRNPRRTDLSLKCSIKICHSSTSAKDSNITVDAAAYRRKGRRSLRLAKKSQEPTSENASDLGKHAQAGKVKKDTDPTEPRPAVSTSTATKPPPFALEPWTEVYRPQRSAEVIGNPAQVEKLWAWLGAWKTRCCGTREDERTKPPKKEAQSCDETKPSKISEKGRKDGPSVRESAAPQASAAPWWETEKDSDFLSLSHLRRRRCHAPRCLDSSASDGESSGEEDEESSLCPVTLLCGPHGCGKSAAVYVCAQELGFKVFEVNSSAVRSRHTIMGTLREATLSHQVVMATTQSNKPAQVTGGIASFFGSAKSDASTSKGVKASKVSKPAPNSGGLYSFFKPEKEVKGQRDNKEVTSVGDQRRKNDGTGSDSELRTKKKQRRSRKTSTITIDDTPDDIARPPVTTEHAQSNNSVALATATVILLDEVDVLFDEDKGFWSAVYELIATTKRPIVMTCNDARYDLECDHQKLLFSSPPTPELSLHMQLLCLSHGAHMTSRTANQIAAFLNCDIRKVVNCLQFWLLLLPSNKSNAVTLEQQPLESAPAAGKVASEGHSPQSCSRKEDQVLSLEHLLGLSAGERQLLRQMQQPQLHSTDPAILCGVLETLHRNGLEVAHPLDRVQPGRAGERPARTSCHPTSVDAMDTASGGADACSDRAGTGPSCSRSQPAVDRTEDSATGSSLEAEVIERDEQLLAVERTLGVPWRNCPNSETTALKNPCLDSLSNFSDTLSLVDTIAVRSRDSHVTRLSDAWWKCELETGLLDELPLGGCGDCWKAEVVCTSEEIVGVAEGLAMGGCRRGMREIGSCGDLYGLANLEKKKRRVEVVQSSLRECSGVFAPHWELSRAAMATEGLPVLQLICHSENLREAAHMKRRFRHCLQASVVDLCHLKVLPRTAAFLSNPHPAEPM